MAKGFGIQVFLRLRVGFGFRFEGFGSLGVWAGKNNVKSYSEWQQKQHLEKEAEH